MVRSTRLCLCKCMIVWLLAYYKYRSLASKKRIKKNWNAQRIFFSIQALKALSLIFEYFSALVWLVITICIAAVVRFLYQYYLCLLWPNQQTNGQSIYRIDAHSLDKSSQNYKVITFFIFDRFHQFHRICYNR